MFNIFINDIFLFSDSNIYNYADDNCISFENRSIDIITDTLHKVSVSVMEWFRENSLAANPAKFVLDYYQSGYTDLLQNAN